MRRRDKHVKYSIENSITINLDVFGASIKSKIVYKKYYSFDNQHVGMAPCIGKPSS